jgi:hypothetical protein
LDYVLPDRASKWRLNWYNELKIPLLTSIILHDYGKNNLEERVNVLHKLVTEEIVPALPETSPVLTSEERFCMIGLRNKKLHATAKLYIMEILNQVKDPTKTIAN